MRKRLTIAPARPGTKRNEQGSTTIEFALLMPVLVTFFMGIIEVSMIMFISLLMDAAISYTARMGKTGYADPGLTQSQTITANLNQFLGTMIDTTSLAVNSTAYADFSQVGVNGSGTAGYGTAGQVVVYTVTYPWQILTPFLNGVIGTNGVYNIQVETVVKNEPYSVGR